MAFARWTPISGRIGTIAVYAGSLAQPATPMLTVTQLDPIAVSFPVPEGRLQDLLAAARNRAAVMASVAGSPVPLQGVLSLAIFTHMLARFGNEVLAGYGVGARLEYLLSTLAFAVGIAAVPMVGMAIGAGRVARARRVAWTAASLAFTALGLLGTLIAIYPDLWVSLFTSDAGVRAASQQYLATAAPMYAFLGLATTMYFSAQGAARVLGPVLAQSARLIFICIGGWYLVSIDATSQNFFRLTAASMVLLGVLSVLSVVLSNWGAKAGPVPRIRPTLS